MTHADGPRGVFISSDPSFSDSADTLPAVQGQLWEDGEFSLKGDYLVVDLEIQTRSTGMPNVSSNQEKGAYRALKQLQSSARQFLKRGGVIVALYSRPEIPVWRDKKRKMRNTGWLSAFGQVDITEASEVYSIQPNTDSPSTREYFKFVDISEYGISLPKSIDKYQKVAVARRSEEPVGVVLQSYLDAAGLPRTFDGSLVLLPRPKNFSGASQDITKALQGIAEGLLPNTRPETEATLQHFLGEESEEFDLDLDEKLLDRSVAALQRGEPDEAVRAAGLILEERVDMTIPDHVSEGRDGTDLMAAALSSDSSAIPVAEHPGEQDGVMLLAKGLMQGFRNPFSHRTREEGRGKYLDDIDEKDAMTAILLSDFLIRKTEDAASKEE